MKFAEDFRRKSRNLVIGLVGLFLIAFAADRLVGWSGLCGSICHWAIGGILLIIGFSVASIAGRHLTLYGRASENLPRGTTDQLVTQGIFAYVRHSMFSSFMCILFGVGFLLNSRGFTFISAPIGSLYLVWFAYFREEKEALEKFGDAYREYKKHVPPFLPYKKPFRQK